MTSPRILVGYSFAFFARSYDLYENYPPWRFSSGAKADVFISGIIEKFTLTEYNKIRRDQDFLKKS